MSAALLATLALGLANHPGDVAHARAMRVGYRYQYLTAGWPAWNPDGSFASRYVRESHGAGLVPVLTYYTLLQSRQTGLGEAEQDLANLRDRATMRAWYDDLALALRRAGHAAGRRRVVLHVEPDLWGYVQQAARGDDPATVPAAVASTGRAELAGLPDTAAGVARAVVRLRDRVAPRVRLAWHLSVWGTKADPLYSDPPAAQIDRLARRQATFYARLGARFDVVFTDPADRDHGFDAKVNGDRRARWTAGDYRRNVRYLRTFHRRVRVPLALWQVPLGNSRLPDTWGRYRDTHVEALLAGRRTTLKAYRDAGVAAVLFGGGADGTTSERTDGGLFRRLARAYAKRPLRART